MKSSFAITSIKSIAMALFLALPAVADNAKWLSYEGGEGPGKGKHIVLIAADQEYRSEESMPMLAKIAKLSRIE